jgi:hypothetical protein
MTLSLDHVVLKLKEFTPRPRGTVWAGPKSVSSGFFRAKASKHIDWLAA